MKQVLKPNEALAYATNVNYEYGKYVRSMYNEGVSPGIARPVDWFSVLIPNNVSNNRALHFDFENREGCSLILGVPAPEFPAANLPLNPAHSFPAAKHLSTPFPMPFTWHRWCYAITEEFEDGAGITGGNPEVFALRETQLPAAAIALTWSRHCWATNKRGGNLYYALTFLFSPGDHDVVVVDPCSPQKNAKEDDTSNERLNRMREYMSKWRAELEPAILSQLV